MTQDTFSAATTAQLEAYSYDFKSWLDARLPEDLLEIDNVYEDDIIDTMAHMLNESYKKVKYLPKLQDIDSCPQIYLVKLGQLMGIENFDLLKAKILATSGLTESNYTTTEINSFRRYIKESVFRYKKKGTFEAVTKIFYYLNYLIDVEELWTDDWVHYFPEDEILSNLSDSLGLSNLFNLSTLETSGMITSGSITETISDVTSGGNIVRVVQSYNGTQFIVVNGSVNNKLYYTDGDNGFVDSGLENVTDLWTFIHRDPFDPTDDDLKYGLLAYIQNGSLYVVPETDLTSIQNKYTSATVNGFINVDDQSDDRYMYFETDNEVFRIDGNFFSVWTYINKTQYGKIPTVNTDYIIPIDDDLRLYFFKNEYHSDNDYSILARGWTQTIPGSISSTSVPFSAATTSGTATSAFSTGTTTFYDYLSFGKYTSGGTQYYQYTYQDGTSAVVTSGTSGWNPLNAIYYMDEGDIEESDSGHFYYNDSSNFTSAYYYNGSLTLGSSGTPLYVPYNMPDFRVRHARYNYDVIHDRTNDLLMITYQKSNKLYRDYYHNISSGIDPHKKNAVILLEDVQKYLTSEQTDKYILRAYISTDNKKKLIIEGKSVGLAIAFQVFNIGE